MKTYSAFLAEADQRAAAITSPRVPVEQSWLQELVDAKERPALPAEPSEPYEKIAERLWPHPDHTAGPRTKNNAQRRAVTLRNLFCIAATQEKIRGTAGPDIRRSSNTSTTSPPPRAPRSAQPAPSPPARHRGPEVPSLRPPDRLTPSPSRRW